ncbi:hypothetical protein AVEN_203732-1 [Araneus ventricosus]|uniref:Uncharacterized protein n=1 Tax=Araneus ventricosus TaxID=182803 RepID=A0A4Y2VFQ7_ARAVE|nr:hypothetical protein AVEN_131693-1 [Araneus ventricosus]GBO24125.1 hypothetical protein AVEN_203732-1 [Araneus ventricosus]
MIATLNHEKFLTNGRKKSRLIGFITYKFKATGKSVRQVENDSDILILETTLTISKIQDNSTVIIGEDIDLLVILAVRTPPNLEIFLLKPGKGRLSRIFILQEVCGRHIKDNILFLHVFSDYDGATKGVESPRYSPASE